MSEVAYNAEQKLFVISCDGGYTCLGLDYAKRETTNLVHELHTRFGVNVNIDSIDFVEPMQVWAMRERALKVAKSIHDAQGVRFNYGLHPQLIGLEGKRVEVIQKAQDGSTMKTRFIVGKSTGWAPIHLEIRSRNSHGGTGVPSGRYDSVRVVG